MSEVVVVGELDAHLEADHVNNDALPGCEEKQGSLAAHAGG